jgi:hypothetical protein
MTKFVKVDAGASSAICLEIYVSVSKKKIKLETKKISKKWTIFHLNKYYCRTKQKANLGLYYFMKLFKG